MNRSERPVRRVVTGNGPDGKSRIVSDSANPWRYPRGGGSKIIYNELWTFDASPALLNAEVDGANRPMSVSPPAEGAHFRITQAGLEDNAAVDPTEAAAQFAAMNQNALSETKSGARHWHMHRTRTVDYGIVLWGERVQVLPDSEFTMRKGDVIIQLAHWHSWDNTNSASAMMFDMIGGEFPDGSR